MVFIILNIIVLLSGLAFVLYQAFRVCRPGSDLNKNIESFLMGGRLLLISFLSVLFSIISARELELTGAGGILLISAVTAAVVYGAILFCWFIMTRKLFGAMLQKETVKDYPFIVQRLRKHYFNLTIYGLVYSFAVLYFMIVLLNFKGG